MTNFLRRDGEIRFAQIKALRRSIPKGNAYIRSAERKMLGAKSGKHVSRTAREL